MELTAIIQGLTDEQLLAIKDDRSEDFDLRLEAASEIGHRAAQKRDANHAASHGGRVRRITVGRRPGYRGETVCADCYYGSAR